MSKTFRSKKGKNGKTVHYPITERTGKPLRESPMEVRKLEGSARKTFEHYKITFIYSNGKKETVNIASRDADDALNQGLKARKSSLKPVKIIIKDGLGEVLAKVATGIGKLRAGVSQVKRGYLLGRLGALMKEAQSDDVTKRAIARAEIKREFPEIYKNIAFEQV